MCNINKLSRAKPHDLWLLAWLGLVAQVPSCSRPGGDFSPRSETSPPAAPPRGSAPVGPALPLDRIAIVGASISAGFGGTPFGEAFTAAAPRSKVDAAADVMLFRDPVGNIRQQLGRAKTFGASTIVAIDLLFWTVYGSSDRAWHDQALAAGIAELEALRAAGAWIVVGDIPLITTASELLLPKAAIPSPELLGAANNAIAELATRERVLLVPLTAWTEPLRAGTDVTLRGGDTIPAASLMALDGLHANPLGVWYLLDKLDLYIETKLPGTPKDALVFARPPAE